MYYQKHDDIPLIPESIRTSCIKVVEDNLINQVPLHVSYRNYETSDQNSVCFVEPGDEYKETNGKETAYIGFYVVPDDIKNQIQDFFKNADHAFQQYQTWLLQISADGDFVGPHIDGGRIYGSIFVLKSGGKNVRTRWYEIKDEFKHLAMKENTYIPYSRLNIVEDHCLDENEWHFMNFSKIHSVENQKSIRIALYGF